MALEFAPNAIRDILTGQNAPTALASLVGDRVTAMIRTEGAPFPAITYGELEAVLQRTKDGSFPNGYEFQVKCHADQQTGGYMTTRKLARMVKNTLDGATADVMEDHHLADEFATIRFDLTGQDDLEFLPEKNEFITALMFRASKV